MKWPLGLLLIFLTLGETRTAWPQSDPPVPLTGYASGIPMRDVAVPLRNAWLRFHEERLCLGVDAIFVFQARGLEIWCRVRDQRSYQDLTDLLSPLQKAYRIEVYTTPQDRDKKTYSLQDEDPPPSLWTNLELRGYLRDPIESRFPTSDDWSGNQSPDSNRDPALKRRLKLFSDQIFEWSQKMESLADDLPSLAGAAYGAEAGSDEDTRARARAACVNHAREIEKYAGRLETNLGHAFPRGAPDSKSAQPGKRTEETSDSPKDDAVSICARALDLSRRIRRFFYPSSYTVTLSDLREPRLIDLLKELQQSASAFERGAPRAR